MVTSSVGSWAGWEARRIESDGAGGGDDGREPLAGIFESLSCCKSGTCICSGAGVHCRRFAPESLDSVVKSSRLICCSWGVEV